VKLLVYLRDGRTVYRLRGRKVLARLVRLDPWHEEQGSVVDRGIWNHDTGEYNWLQLRIRHIAAHSISHVEEVPPGA
jgi:hypothetical protein